MIPGCVCLFILLQCFAASAFVHNVGWVGVRDSCCDRRQRRALKSEYVPSLALALAAQDEQAIFSQAPEEIFAELSSNTNDWLGIDDLKAWGELQDLMDDQDLLPQELEDLFANELNKKQSSPNDDDNNNKKLDQNGFVSLYNSIDSLFEGEEDLDGQDGELLEEKKEASRVILPEEQASPPPSSKKDDLLKLLSDMNIDEANSRLPCGLQCTDAEREAVASLVDELEHDGHSNLVRVNNGKVEAKSLIGDWELLYTNSRTMAINKSLSGLGRSASSMANIRSLTQRLAGSKYQGTVEFLERFDSFNVTVTGEWYLEDDRDPVTGALTTAEIVDPQKVIYGPITNDAEQWDGLGPIRVLHIIYFADDLKILRGKANTDTFFVFQKSK
jgi:hypothetical protein